MIRALAVIGALVSGGCSTGAPEESKPPAPCYAECEVVPGFVDIGGSITDYRRAGGSDIAYHAATGKKRRIADHCYSACTIRADFARKATCVTADTHLYFHAGFEGNSVGPRLHNLPYSEEIRQWINERGGLPTDGVLIMTPAEAQKFWSVCE